MLFWCYFECNLVTLPAHRYLFFVQAASQYTLKSTAHTRRTIR